MNKYNCDRCRTVFYNNIQYHDHSTEESPCKKSNSKKWRYPKEYMPEDSVSFTHYCDVSMDTIIISNNPDPLSKIINLYYFDVDKPANYCLVILNNVLYVRRHNIWYESYFPLVVREIFMKVLHTIELIIAIDNRYCKVDNFIELINTSDSKRRMFGIYSKIKDLCQSGSNLIIDEDKTAYRDLIEKLEKKEKIPTNNTEYVTEKDIDRSLEHINKEIEESKKPIPKEKQKPIPKPNKKSSKAKQKSIPEFNNDSESEELTERQLRNMSWFDFNPDD